MSPEKINELKDDKSFAALKLLLENLSEKHELNKKDILELFEQKENAGVPLSAFSNNKLSCLEIIVKYLKENLAKTYHEIALQLNRNDRTIWSTYNNSLKKYKQKLSVSEEVIIPISLFASRKKSVLESLVVYLKDDLGFEYNKISNLLLKDYQTIYTTYRRGISK